MDHSEGGRSTIDIDGRRIRLFGIDAPEGRQTCTHEGRSWECGREAAGALQAALQNNPVRCEPKDIDRYKRIVSVCFMGATNLNDLMVRSGWALAYRQFSNDYVPAEAEASRNKSGIWRGTFRNPWDWRRKSKG